MATQRVAATTKGQHLDALTTARIGWRSLGERRRAAVGGVMAASYASRYTPRARANRLGAGGSTAAGSSSLRSSPKSPVTVYEYDLQLSSSVGVAVEIERPLGRLKLDYPEEV